MDAYSLVDLQKHRARLERISWQYDRPGPNNQALRCALAALDAEIARRAQAALLDELAEVVK